MNVLGLKIRGHDTGAALIADEKIVAIAEERLSRIKHSPGMFPKLSIAYCLEALGVKPEEVNLVVIDQTGARSNVPMKERFLRETGNTFLHASIQVINHHDAHAASAFFCSPFKEAAIFVYDGAGEIIETHLGVAAVETETLYRGQDNRIHQIQKTTHLREGKVFPYTFGIGKLYTFLSETYLSFGGNNEGKMMGLAAYGTDSLLRQIPYERWCREKDGHIVCNARIAFPKKAIKDRVALAFNAGRLFSRTRGFIRTKVKSLLRRYVRRAFVSLYGTVFTEPELFEKIILHRPKRDPSERLPEEYYASVAYAGQKILERAAIGWGRKLREITASENICVAGGVGLNIDANLLFLNEVGFNRIFVQPGASDTGIPLGCALHGWHVILEKPRFWIMKNAGLGRKYSQQEILQAIQARSTEVHFERSVNIACDAANRIAAGHIIGWFQEGAEYGPRALGNRSILCDARNKHMKDTLNNKVKHREPWRPFGASVLREHMSQWFEVEEESPFMLLAAPVRTEKRELIQAVVHVDGTCRIQSVTKESNGRYYDLIAKFHELTGVPLILNTSFNLAGEPIVETPLDALECFLSTKMDYLVLEDYLISKRG